MTECPTESRISSFDDQVYQIISIHLYPERIVYELMTPDVFGNPLDNIPEADLTAWVPTIGMVVYVNAPIQVNHCERYYPRVVGPVRINSAWNSHVEVELYMPAGLVWYHTHDCFPNIHQALNAAVRRCAEWNQAGAEGLFRITY